MGSGFAFVEVSGEGGESLLLSFEAKNNHDDRPLKETLIKATRVSGFLRGPNCSDGLCGWMWSLV